MTYVTKNHKTTTNTLVAVAALAAILVAAGTVAAAGSYHSAFAHKKGAYKSFQNSGIAVPTITAQEQQCSTAGSTSPIDTSCTATSTNTITESGGTVK
jgi:hypothetical protein